MSPVEIAAIGIGLIVAFLILTVIFGNGGAAIEIIAAFFD
jgi:hypothetical protein